MMKINKVLFIFAFTLLPLVLSAQQESITISGIIKDKTSEETLSFVNVVLLKSVDSTFISGTITDESGLFTLSDLIPADYILETSYIGYQSSTKSLYVGSKSDYLNLGNILMVEDATELGEVLITATQSSISGKLDKKSYSLDENVSQSGGSILQSLQNLPGITAQDGKVRLRGNDQVLILVDGKQSAITGFGNQNGLDNIPASSIDKIEIINNPSAKFDANGNAGIINIIFKKDKQEGFNGKFGLTGGLGALWIRKENFKGIRPQYVRTPKINPSLALNYRKLKTNLFLQVDDLYSETLNKNEFVTRTYSGGSVIQQQLKRNRNTNFLNVKAGVDYEIDDQSSLTISGLYSQETIIDRGDQPFLNTENQQIRLWQFLEDEVLTAIMGSINYEYRFKQAGHKINAGFNYTFDREDEKYFFDNTLPEYESKESFKLIADQRVADFNIDYTRPLRNGLLESGVKIRRRTIPTDMQFFPGFMSPLDPNADGIATYKEFIPAIYSNYTYEIKKFEAELGLRIEYVLLEYDVDLNHNTYTSDGYSYFQPFPNARLTYNIDLKNKISVFYNRRVDRPDEVDIRIFPKYDDAEIIKVGNPALRPQFTNKIELGYKNLWESGFLFMAAYFQGSEGTITRIATTVPGSNLIYNISQNAGKSSNSGVEFVLEQDISKAFSVNLNVNAYQNQIEAFSVLNKYPIESIYNSDQQKVLSGNVKLNGVFHFDNGVDGQISAIYLAKDIIPQGTIDPRFSLDMGIKKSIQAGKGEIFLNVTDLFNTMVIRKEIIGKDFSYTSSDYYETQVLRAGYSYKF